eukprot:TRINITY_DN15345_c0_g2_i1.p4 TRINITY_DN15345_c0_g2~~TRINITY_DN15345_c0_g2_i1.p4  ORF type:complete len:120 (+),score=1.36 TRINITY_DN15345_c0_g2_i1:67-426(+)
MPSCFQASLTRFLNLKTSVLTPKHLNFQVQPLLLKKVPVMILDVQKQKGKYFKVVAYFGICYGQSPTKCRRLMDTECESILEARYLMKANLLQSPDFSGNFLEMLISIGLELLNMIGDT